MVKPMVETLQQSIRTVEALYHRLVLLVGGAGTGKTSALRQLADETGSPIINVNLAISSKLLELSAKQRPLRLPNILGDIVDQGQSPVLLDNLEILFDPDLKQDPLRLLQSISRNHTVVASWNGSLASGRLVYAEPGHPEYRNYESTDALIVGMDSTATTGTTTNATGARQA